MMADDITLTVRVRDMSRGDFDRLKARLEGMRRSLQGVNRDTDSAGMHSRRLGDDIGDLTSRLDRMQRSGNLTSRELTQMRGALDRMGRSALNAARSGEISTANYHRFSGELEGLRGQLNRLGNGLNSNTNTIRRNTTAQRGNANQMRTTVRLINGMVQSVRTNSRSMDGNTRIISTWRNEVDRAGSSVNRLGNNTNLTDSAFGNMHAKLIGIAVLLVATLLPAIGALAPMLAGIGSVVGVAALAFSGLSKSSKKLTKDEKEFLTALKPLKTEFSELQKTARKAILPELTKSFNDVGKAMKAMNPVIKIAGDTFGKLVQRIAKGVSSKGFLDPFIKNVKMGNDWLLQFTGSFGTFLKSFLDFGTKSKPSLDAWQNLLGGFLDRGLPGMFTNMESGIKGASGYLNGLASVINDGLLPGLGNLLGKFMEAFGPSMGNILRTAGKYIRDIGDAGGQTFQALHPLVTVVGNVANSLLDLSRISFGSMFDTLKELGGALLKTFVEVFSQNKTKGLVNSLDSLSSWVTNNEGAIRSAFDNLGIAFIEMIGAIVKGAPIVAEVFSAMVKSVLGPIGILLKGLAVAFGWVPKYGSKFKNASSDFDQFKNNFTNGLDAAVAKSREFADKAGPNLSRAELSIKVDDAKRNIADIEADLNNPQLTKKRRAELEVEKSKAEADLAAAQAKLNKFDGKTATAKIDANASAYFGKVNAANNAKVATKRGTIEANPSPFWRALQQVQGFRVSGKSVSVTANANSFWGRVRSLVGRSLGTSYIDVQMRKSESNASPYFKANGGIMKFYADGGTEDHKAQIAPAGSWRVWGEPETGGEAYIPLSPGKRTRSRQIADTTVGMLGGRVEWYASGGMTKAEKQARSDAAGSFGISHFGRMAGYKHTPFETSVGAPAALGDLVGALNSWRSTILKATHGAVEKNLLKSLDKAGKSLIGYEKKLAKVNSSLDKAKTNLDNLKQAAASLRDSVTSGVMSSTDITRIASNDPNVTMSDVMGGMQQSLDQSTAFADALKQLKAKGVSATVISQIAQAGISGGGLQTATALLGASGSEISQINSMQKQINAAAKSAGNTAADAMYGAGIKAAQGLVDGLTKKQKAIEDAMMKIAKSMERAIKKALGIHSPSRVMMKVGDNTAEGFALGIKNNRSTDTAWTSMLNSRSSTSSSASYGGSSGGTQHFHIYVGQKKVDEVVLDAGRRVVRTHGKGDVQKTFGRKTS